MTTAPSQRREPARCPPRARGRDNRPPAGGSPRFGLFATVLFFAIVATALCVVAAPAEAQGATWAQAAGPAQAPADDAAAIGTAASRYAQAWIEGNASGVSAL